MKTTHLGLLISCCALIVGCSSTPTDTPSTAATPPAPAPAPAAPPTASAQGTASSTVSTVALHLDPNSPISTQRSVYFEFDDSAVRNEDISIIERHGKYLGGLPALAIRIEGNADERGSAEYNLALGQRRAESVARALKIYGLKDTQMEAVSYGEEKPKAQGHDDSAWAQNRRADLVYPRQ